MTLSDKSWRVAIVSVGAVAVLLRFVAFDLKPLHHDEGVNAFFLLRLVKPPHFYHYDPSNYHGPSLYYLAWLSSALFGLTTFSLRLVPILAGLLTIGLVLPLRRYLGDIATLTAMLMLALSPGAVFNSRYFIHEILLVCATLGVVVGVLDHLEGRTRRGILVAALAAAAMTTTKETWFISLGVLACAVFGTVVLCRIPPSRVIASLKVPFLLIVAALAVFVGVNVLFYSSLFTHWEGLRDFFRAYDFWSATGAAVPHRRPWYGYLEWLARIELPLLIGGAAGALLAALRRDNPLAVFAGLWAVGMVAAYSLIPYKTPWLMLNFLPPLALCAGYLASWLASFPVRSVRVGLIPLGGVALVAMTFQSVSLNFFRYDDDRLPYVYSATTREIYVLMSTVRGLSFRSGKQLPVVMMVTADAQFPFPWYFRDMQVGYTGKVEPLAEGVAVVRDTDEAEAARVLGDRFVRVGLYNLRPGVKLVVFANCPNCPR